MLKYLRRNLQTIASTKFMHTHPLICHTWLHFCTVQSRQNCRWCTSQPWGESTGGHAQDATKSTLRFSSTAKDAKSDCCWACNAMTWLALRRIDGWIYVYTFSFCWDKERRNATKFLCRIMKKHQKWTLVAAYCFKMDRHDDKVWTAVCSWLFLRCKEYNCSWVDECCCVMAANLRRSNSDSAAA